MKKSFISLLVFTFIVLPVNAQTSANDFSYILDVVSHMKSIILQQKDEQASRSILSKIKDAQPLIKNDQYQGHQIISGREITGFIGINYLHNKANIAVFSTPPLRVRHATKTYKGYRTILSQQYKEISHNHFDLGQQVIARLTKKARKVSIDVYRDK